MIQNATLQHLCTPVSGPPMLPESPGYVQIRPSEPCARAMPVYQLAEPGQQDWSYGPFWKRPTRHVHSLGCYFVDDVDILFPGFVTRSGHVLSDGSLPARIALSSVSPEDVTIATASPARVIDAPVLMLDGAGTGIWGHWLAEFLPRAAIARETLGPLFDTCVIPLPTWAPAWIEALLAHACGVRPEAVLRYTPKSERLVAARAIIPTFGFTGEYTFHSFVRAFYESLRPKDTRPKRRICLSRGGDYALRRNFIQRELFEAMAADHGFEVIRPEHLSLEQQIRLFAEAAVIIGEYGSALHSSVFAHAGIVIGCIGHWNAVQMRLNDLCRQKTLYLTRGCHWPSDGKPMFIDCAPDDLHSFLKQTLLVANGEKAASQPL